jgi:cellulose synthase/poly-beta-1,6-N-acetylglucosamine synthase-like glycosyltransferase
MTTAAATIAWAAFFLIGYVYVGYPLVLWMLTRWRRQEVRQRDVTLSVTLLISAFNEERVIKKKLENSLALDYPSERLEIFVVSDASTDGTDLIVQSFASRGVRLLRMAERGGKSLGLNAAMQKAKGDIVLFSDANIVYQPDVIRRLVRNFADAAVGCVTGYSCYAENYHSAAHNQENHYWQYEQRIRAWESQLGSTVGGDGAIFSIRRKLYQPIAADAINDLVIPLQIVASGFRAVFEPTAVGYERSAGGFAGEFRRKRRIVNRSWRGVWSVREVLDPRVVGVFAWQVWSHKVLRWLVLPMVLTVGAGCFFAFPVGVVYRVGALGFLLSILAAITGGLARNRIGRLASLGQSCFYFYMVNLAACLGVLTAIGGRVQVIWTPERG